MPKIARAMKKLKTSAPGKVILSGEHAVVYGYHAILTAVNRRLSVSFEAGEKKIDSTIPVGCGMGSSAAYAVALSACRLLLQGKPWDLDRINNAAYKIEKRRHGNPSGGDNTISTYGGYLWFRRRAGDFKTFSPIKIKRNLPKFFLINSGKPKESTKEMISFVQGLMSKNPKRITNIFKRMGEVSKELLGFLLAEKTPKVGELIKENEKLLEALGVVSSQTMELIRRIEKVGGSAKITGAGGKKAGSGIVLVYHSQPERLLSYIRNLHLDISSVKFGEKGVRIEKNN